MAHRERAAHVASHPVHVTLRAHGSVPWLRAQRIAPHVIRALGRASKESFRILHFSVQGNHVHLLVEADDRTALSRGLQGLSIRIARRINALLGRRGVFWGDRYHARPLRTPREVRQGLVYVLMNHKKHERAPGSLDRLSSAHWFPGWHPSSARHLGQLPRPLGPREEAAVGPPVQPAGTWLANFGWRRHGLLRADEAPAP